MWLHITNSRILSPLNVNYYSDIFPIYIDLLASVFHVNKNLWCSQRLCIIEWELEFTINLPDLQNHFIEAELCFSLHFLYSRDEFRAIGGMVNFVVKKITSLNLDFSPGDLGTSAVRKTYNIQSQFTTKNLIWMIKIGYFYHILWQ